MKIKDAQLMLGPKKPLYLEDIPEDYRTPSDEQLWEVYDQILYIKWGFDRWDHYLRTIGMTRSKANRVVNRQYTARAVEKVIARAGRGSDHSAGLPHG